MRHALVIFVLLATASVSHAQDLTDLTRQIENNPKDAQAYLRRGALYEKAGKLDEARADYSKVIELDPKSDEAYHRRGGVHFKLLRFEESVRDFDREIALKPERKVSHWQRGISCFYAGQYAEGRRQFEGYQDFDRNDVENAIWRFMCMVRGDGLAKARAAMLKIGDDRRVPMRQVYDLYKGDLKPEDVFTAARAAEQAKSPLFYAHLYVGIYYDLLGDPKRAFEHVNRAAEEYRISHYMGDVARVHRDVLRKHAKGQEKGD
jgi:lipoprotein NlpI